MIFCLAVMVNNASFAHCNTVVIHRVVMMKVMIWMVVVVGAIESSSAKFIHALYLRPITIIIGF